jgi:hypothetical protein
MPPDRASEGWRDEALILDMALAAEDALSFVADLDERAFLASDLHQRDLCERWSLRGDRQFVGDFLAG